PLSLRGRYFDEGSFTSSRLPLPPPCLRFSVFRLRSSVPARPVCRLVRSSLPPSLKAMEDTLAKSEASAKVDADDLSTVAWAKVDAARSSPRHSARDIWAPA